MHSLFMLLNKLPQLVTFNVLIKRMITRILRGQEQLKHALATRIIHMLQTHSRRRHIQQPLEFRLLRFPRFATHTLHVHAFIVNFRAGMLEVQFRSPEDILLDHSRRHGGHRVVIVHDAVIARQFLLVDLVIHHLREVLVAHSRRAEGQERSFLGHVEFPVSNFRKFLLLIVVLAVEVSVSREIRQGPA